MRRRSSWGSSGTSVHSINNGWAASAGAELVVDLAVQYDVPYRVRLAVAKLYTAPRERSRSGSIYVTPGGYF